MKSSLHCLSLAALAAPALAQLSAPTGEQFDAQAVTAAALTGTWDGFQGVVRTTGNRYWVSARRSAPSASLHLLEFNDAGAYLSNVTLPASLSASTTGLLDLAYDPISGVIWGGCEHAVSGRQLIAFRISTRTFDTAVNVPVPTAAGGNAARGLTFDRLGNAGQGAFLCVDGNSPIVEFSRTGTLLRTIPNPHPNATALAVDPTDRRLWVLGPGGSTKANEGCVGMAIDLESGQTTSLRMLGSPSFAGTPAGGNVTGAEFASYAHDHVVYRLSLVTNANSDWVYELEGRFAYGATCGGRIGFQGDAPYAGNAAWAVTLQGSPSASAFLMLGVGETTTPITAPFATGCYLHLTLTPAPLLLGAAAVTSGNAQLAIPLPVTFRGSIWMQWIEASAGLPLRASDGGAVYVR